MAAPMSGGVLREAPAPIAAAPRKVVAVDAPDAEAANDAAAENNDAADAADTPN